MVNVPTNSGHSDTDLHFLNIGVHEIIITVPRISCLNLSFLSFFMLSFLQAEAEAATLTFTLKPCLNEGVSHS